MRIEGNGQLTTPSPTIGDYWTAIYRRAWIIALVAISAVVACALISNAIPEQYEAKAVFYVPRDAQASVGISPRLLGARLPSGVQDHARAFAEIIKQPDAWRAVNQRCPQKPISRFWRDVDIVAARQGTIAVYVRDRDPLVAADVANALVQHFNEFNQEIILDDIEKSMVMITSEIERKDEEILSAIEESGDFLEKHRIASLATQRGELERRRIALEAQLLEAHLDRRAIDDRLASLAVQIAEESDGYRAGDILARSTTLDVLEQSLASLYVLRAGRLSDLTEEHPTIEAIDRQIAETQERIEAEVSRLVRNEEKPATLYAELRRQHAVLEVDRDVIGPRISGIEGALSRIDEDIASLPEIITESTVQSEALAHLRTTRANMESARNSLLTQSLEIRDTALVIQKATVPGQPTYPNVTLNIAVAGLLGLIAGIIYALLVEHARERRRVRKLANLELERWAETLIGEKMEVAT